ncbi:type II secretion system protein N [Frateuria aurantia]|nr:type II secretion system protein N [Frateuria aurantia]
MAGFGAGCGTLGVCGRGGGAMERCVLNVVRYLMVWGLVISLMLLLMVAFLPASWALGWYGERLPGLRLQQVSGTVWKGQAGQVLTRAGFPLGGLRWQLSPSILLGRADLHWQLNGPRITASGQLQREADARLVIDHVRLRSTPAALAQWFGLPVMPVAGQWYLDISHAVVWHGWPMTLEAQLAWRDAGVTASGQKLALGNLLLHARSQQGVMTAELEDDGGGPLHVHGQGRLHPLGWSFQVDAAAGAHQPALAAWLAGFGVPDEHGMVDIRRSGGMLDNLQ